MKKPEDYPFLRGGGEMGVLTRAHNWSETPLGSPDKWCLSLRATVSNLLRSRFPMFLWWGPEMIQFYNDAYRPSFGREGKHPVALGQKGKECWPEIWPIIYPLIREVRETGEATWREDQLVPIYRNGKIEDVYWTYSYSSVLDDEGNHGGILVTCSETTEKVNNLRQLEEHKDRLHFTIEAAELATWEYDLVNNKITGNHRLTDWFGLPPGGESIQGFLQVVKETDRARVAQAVDQALDYHSGGGYNIEYMIVHPDTKQERIVKSKGRVWYDENNKPYLFNGTVQDVTQESTIRKELADKKQSLELALEISELGVFDINLETDSAVCSTQIMKWFGLKSAHIDMSLIWPRVHEEDRAMVRKAIEDSIQGLNEGKHDITYRLNNPLSGDILYLRSIGKVQHVNGQPANISGIIEDVTPQMLAKMQVEEVVKQRTRELAKSNELLLKSNDELLRTNKSLEEFAFAASHDLKEPIRKIQYFSVRLMELLSDRFSEEEKSYFTRLEAATRRMSTLIDDLLTYSQVSVPPGRFEEVDVNQLVNLVLNELGMEIEQKKARVSVEKLCKVKGHQRQLHQMFQNLLGNALKYTRDGVLPEISVSCTPVRGSDTGWNLSEQEMEKDYYLIEIRDNGIGFNQEEADRLFNVFTRLHGNAEYKGTGVGLSIVRKVVENHNAHVSARGELSKGASFLILFPAEQAQPFELAGVYNKNPHK